MMRIRLLRLIFRNLKFYYYIPLIVIWGIVPLHIMLNVRTYGIGNAGVESVGQMFIPIFATWWIFCLLKEYIEGDGLELLYSYLNKKKSKAQDILLVFIWYALHVILLFFMLNFWLDNMFMECIRVLIQSFFLISFYYCLTYAMKSTSISYIFVLSYYFMCLFFSDQTMFAFINIFSTGQPMSMYLLIPEYAIVLGVGVLLFLLGNWMNCRYYRLFDSN